ncbi:MAG: DUF2911 domain-containing protein [Cryomorphaceae bacterium]
MKKIYSILVATLIATGISAQDLPKPSPSAKVEQRVGLTDISVTYSRPGVKGREIWGDLVPYNELWRAGANKATLFSTSSDITIQGQSLAKGDYSLFIIPNENAEWTMIWNKETELWGEGDYKKENDALRINVPAESVPEITERLEYRFMDIDMSTAHFAMDWAGKRLHVAIDADPSAQAIMNIEQAIKDSKPEDLWRVYRNAASYAEDNNMTKKGLEWIAKSVELKKDSWYSYWVYGSILAQNNEFKKAIEMGKKSIKVGNETDENFDYTDRIQADIDKWSKK